MLGETPQSYIFAKQGVQLKDSKIYGLYADMTYAEYVAAHSSEWTNIMTNLGFYWADASAAVAEPNWDSLDWATLTQAAK